MRYIKIMIAEDDAGTVLDPAKLDYGLREHSDNKWPGGALALKEIAAAGLDAERIAKAPSSVIASHLVLARCFESEDLPDLSVCQARIIG
ncbi:MAG: hypothetical protein ISN29_03545 [Gammaproteobacteria bacterium AqS3]|nr:hypothetical protein [Gammaproteobacteria bacterium AqS3]